MRRLLVALIVAIAGLVVSAALLPVRVDSNEELFEIPRGTWALRRSGSDVEILPSEIRLIVKLRNVLVLRNLDDVPQIFGPALIMPGQTLRLPFNEVSENQFVCTAHASGQLTVYVDPIPESPQARLSWRLHTIKLTLSRLRWSALSHG